MVKLPIFQREIELAKSKTSQFDSQKVHDKFKCNNNYIGYLGEYLFDKYLTYKRIYHKWFQFVKQDMNTPDFTIGHKTVDVKTTFDDKLWLQNIDHNIYVLINISKDVNTATILGYVDSYDLVKYVENKEYTVVVRGNNKNYVFDKYHLRDISDLFKKINYFNNKGWDF